MTSNRNKLVWDKDQVMTWLRREFPQAFLHGGDYEILELEPGRARVRCVLDETALRPGGTVMGPAMMRAADITCYVILLAHGGEAAGDSVTTNMAMSFLRRPAPGDIEADVTVLKHGRTLVVMDAKIYSSASGDLIANSEMSYFNAAAQ